MKQGDEKNREKKHTGICGILGMVLSDNFLLVFPIRQGAISHINDITQLHSYQIISDIRSTQEIPDTSISMDLPHLALFLLATTRFCSGTHTCYSESTYCCPGSYRSGDRRFLHGRPLTQNLLDKKKIKISTASVADQTTKGGNNAALHIPPIYYVADPNPNTAAATKQSYNELSKMFEEFLGRWQTNIIFFLSFSSAS